MPEESVTVYLPISNDDMGESHDWKEMMSLEKRLGLALDQPLLLAMLKVTRAEEGFCKFKITGPNADKIYQAIEQTLANSRLSPEGYVMLRYADSREPVKKQLRASKAIIRNFRLELTIGIGVAAGLLALALHFFFALPDDDQELPPWEKGLLVLEGASVFLGVGFYASRQFVRWIGDHYSEMVLKENQAIFLRWVNCLCGFCLVLTRGLLTLIHRRVRIDDSLLLLLGAYLVVSAFWQHYREARMEQAS